MASSGFEEGSDGRELVGSPLIKKCHLDQPLDTEMERLLIRAAVMVGYQVFVTEVSDGPLSIETADPADVGLPEPTRVDNDIRRLFIDGREITFVLAPETWSQTPRREDWIYEDIQSSLLVHKPGAGKVQDSKLLEYRVQYGDQVERQAREEDQTGTADTACLPVEPTNQTAPSPLERVPAPSERATQEGRDQGHGAPPMTDEGPTVRSQAMSPPETRQRAITKVGRMETVDEFKSLPPVLLRELGLEILMERVREFDPGDTPDAPPVKSGDGAHADGVGQPASEKEIGADRDQGTGDETDTEKGNKRKVLLLKMPASLPLDKPPTGIFATGPSIEKMVAEHPELLPTVSLIARLEMAQAEAEVAFRRREATEDWGSWSGVHPWDDKPELETTDCPWWVAGAEYEFRMAAEWRQYFPAKPERTRALLPAQLRSLAKDVYQNRVFYYDLIYSKHPKGKDLSPQTHVERFSNFAFLSAVSKFAEKDLSEWEQRAAQTTGAIIDLKAGHSSARPGASVSDPSKVAAQEDPTGGEAGPTERSATDTPAAHSPKPPVLASHKTPPRRTPDLQSSRARVDLVSTLASELATIKHDLNGFCTAESLKKKHPEFVLWGYITDIEIKELVDGTAFTPKAWAENLTLRKFGLTSRETIKKDRKKLRQAQRVQPRKPSS